MVDAIRGKTISIIGRLGLARRCDLADRVAAAGGRLQRGVNRRTDLAVVGRRAVAMIEDGGLMRRVTAADAVGAAVVSEGTFVAMLDGAARDDAPRSLTASQVLARAGIDDETLRVLALFDVVRPRDGVYGFQDAVAAREVARLLSDGAALGDIIAGAGGVRRVGGGAGAHMAGAKLVVGDDGGLALQVGSGQADLDGQLRIALPQTENPSTDDLFAAAEDAEAEGDLLAAEALYRRCIEREKDDCPARFNLANVLRGLHRRREAKAMLGEVLRRDTGFAEAWYNLADLAQADGDPAEAARCLEAALAADGDYADALYNLARLRFQSGDYDDAQTYWQRYLRYDDTSSWSRKARDGLALCRHYLRG